MNKEGFLNELRGHLRVLDEKEQQDIIDEYAQHIDLKIKSGLSEEEAISDFGNVEELARDILEAYHVDPKFEERRKEIVIRTPDMESVSQQGRKLAGKIKGLWNRIKESIRKWKDMVQRTWYRSEREEERISNSGGQTVKCNQKKGRDEGQTFWRTVKRLTYNLVVLCWNMACVLIACLLIVTAACSLFGFGMMLCLVFSGYPLVGAELFCFGAALTAAALGLLTFSLRKKYRRRMPDNVWKKQTGEVE